MKIGVVEKLSRVPSSKLTMLTCIGILVVGGLAALMSLSRARAGEAVAHTEQVLHTADELLSGLVNAETGQRGFLLTGDSQYLDRFQSGLRTTAGARRRLRTLLAGDTAQALALIELEAQAAAKGNELERAIALKQDGFDSAAVALVRSNEGKRIMNSARSVAARIEARERQVLGERQALENRRQRGLLAVLVLGTLGAALFAMFGGMLTTRALRREHQLNAELSRRTEEVAENRRILQSILEGTTDSIFLKDRSLRYIVANGPTARVLGRTPAEMIGKTDQELFPPDVVEWLVPQDQRLMAEGRTEVLEEQLETDGQIRWFLTTKSPWRNERGEVIGLIGVSRDITERRELEHRLRQVGRLEAVGRLGGGVAHEVNNQMTVVLGSADFLLRNTNLPELARRDLENIQRAAERSAAITSQLLAFSRRQIFQPKVLEINELIREFEPVLHRMLAESHGIELRLDPVPLRIKADRAQLEQVLLNLTINAVDAMPNGGRLNIATTCIVLTGGYAQLRPETAVRPGRYVSLIVSDTGSGMEPETLAHAFEPFFTTKPFGKGTGLGLSSVYGIVKQSGGYIWLYSEPGEGTTVKVYLPQVRAEVEPDAPDPAAPLRESRSSGRVLVVEDDSTVRRMMSRALSDAGFAVVDAPDGRVALEMVQADAELNLVVTDAAMPRLGGRELMRELAAIRPTLRVLTVSGYTDDDILRRGLVEAGYPFLQKPFSPERLVAKVRELVDQAASET
jgi:PAS domain S-box-containing protein